MTTGLIFALTALVLALLAIASSTPRTPALALARVRRRRHY
nr:hypothetical protein [uncultured Holophaga sp.]